MGRPIKYILHIDIHSHQPCSLLAVIGILIRQIGWRHLGGWRTKRLTLKGWRIWNKKLLISAHLSTRIQMRVSHCHVQQQMLVMLLCMCWLTTGQG
jgi:hypothetical protein